MRDPATDNFTAAFRGVVDPDILGQEAQDGQQNMRETQVEIISAVRLTTHQRQMLEIRMIRMLKKRVALKYTVDPDLLGGIRIVADNIVIDDSIKRKLHDMKTYVTKEVFQSE